MHIPTQSPSLAIVCFFGLGWCGGDEEAAISSEPNSPRVQIVWRNNRASDKGTKRRGLILVTQIFSWARRMEKGMSPALEYSLQRGG